MFFFSFCLRFQFLFPSFADFPTDLSSVFFFLLFFPICSFSLPRICLFSLNFELSALLCSFGTHLGLFLSILPLRDRGCSLPAKHHHSTGPWGRTRLPPPARGGGRRALIGWTIHRYRPLGGASGGGVGSHWLGCVVAPPLGGTKQTGWDLIGWEAHRSCSWAGLRESSEISLVGSSAGTTPGRGYKRKIPLVGSSGGFAPGRG